MGGDVATRVQQVPRVRQQGDSKNIWVATKTCMKWAFLSYLDESSRAGWPQYAWPGAGAAAAVECARNTRVRSARIPDPLPPADVDAVAAAATGAAPSNMRLSSGSSESDSPAAPAAGEVEEPVVASATGSPATAVLLT
jgi:hypothetical protein